MRVLFWSETFWPRVGGVENLGARLLRALQGRGYEFAVVTWENIETPDEIRYEGIPVYRFPFFARARHGKPHPVIEHQGLVAQLKRDFAADLVHINSYGRSVLFHLNTIHAHRAPMLLTLHQQLPGEPIAHDSLTGHLLSRADWINACSEAVLVHTRQLMPEIFLRSSLIYNGLEAPSFDPQPMSFDPPRLLCIGRLVEEKGFDLALIALTRILGLFPDARLVIVGDGSQREKLRQHMIELGLVHSVEFAGSVLPETVAHLIDEATLVLIPSRSEGFGLVALEAALMGRPVVATRVGGLPEVVLHEETGLLVEAENSDGLAEAIVRLLNHPESALTLGRSARARAQEIFSWKRHVDAYDALYRKLASPEACRFQVIAGKN